MKYTKFMEQLANYKDTVVELEKQHESISQDISNLQNEKMVYLMNAQLELAEKLDIKIESLTRRQGNINATLLMTPQRIAREFDLMTKEVMQSMKADLSEIQIEYDAQVEEVLKAKEAYTSQVLQLTKVRGKADELNRKFTTLQVEVENLKPIGVERKKISHVGIGQIKERQVFPNGWGNMPEDEMIGISEAFQRRIYPPML